MTFLLSRLDTLDNRDIAKFREFGFLVIPNVLANDQVKTLRASFPMLFSGMFETGIYPDEWYWREGISLPDVTRHMANAWKADLTIARLVLSENIGRAAAFLACWSGARLGQDTIWWKPPKSKAVSFHQDTSFMDFLDPPETITCWIPLDDASSETGTLEYAAGSNRWPLMPISDRFHAPQNYRAPMQRAARLAKVAEPKTTFVECPAGSCVFHAGTTWHGSGPNLSNRTTRRAIAVHLLPANVKFSNRPGGYIYRRYQLTGDDSLNESFFPVLWSRDGRRTDWIGRYCVDGNRQSFAPRNQQRIARGELAE